MCFITGEKKVVLRKFLIALAATVITSTSLIGVSAGPAMATPDDGTQGEINDAVASSGPTGSFTCADFLVGATVCFKPNGDTFYVKDTSADGYTAIVQWYNQAAGTQAYQRWGQCHNHLGNGKWGRCTKNFAESSTLDFRAEVWNFGGTIKFIRGTGLVTDIHASCDFSAGCS